MRPAAPCVLPAPAGDRPVSPERRSRPRLKLHLFVVFLALLGIALVGPRDAAAAPAWTDPDPLRGVVYGVVRDDAGQPVEGATVSVDATVRGAQGNQAIWGRDATDATGRYRVVLPDDQGVSSPGFAASARKLGYLSGVSGQPEGSPPDGWTPPVLWPRAGETARQDLTIRRRSGTLSGRITVRGGAPAAERLTVVVRAEGEPQPLEDVTIQGDGSYAVRVPAGALSVSAESRFGLRREWLGPQPGGGPARNRLVFAADEHRSGIDIELPARLPHSAVDQYGTLHDGSDPQSPSVQPTPRYPVDMAPHPGSITGPLAAVGAFRMPAAEALGDVPWLVRPWNFNLYEIPVANNGDGDLWIHDVRFEGPDASLFRCESHGRSWVPLPCRAHDVVGSRNGVLRMGAEGVVPIVVNQDVHRDVYAATAVIVTNASDSPHRVPMRIVDLTEAVRAACASMPCPPGLEPPAGPAGAAGKTTQDTDDSAWPIVPGAAGPRTSRPTTVLKSAVRLTRSRLRFVLPGAARGQIRIEQRRVHRGKRVWSAVRRSSFSTRRAGTVTHRLKALPAGRYRVHLRVTPRGERARTITAIRRTR